MSRRTNWTTNTQSIYRSETNPLGSASIAQTHRATLRTGEEVVLKLIKPGTRELIQTDSRIIKVIGAFLELFIPHLQPKNMFTEFCEYTNREVDFRLEADNAEEFTINFAKHPEIHFPKIYRQYSTSDLICMQFIRGINQIYVLTKDILKKTERRL
ncbi:MAG: AarF/ABC1/UbiB kinase family protein [Bacteroidetes bacterium]|nr:AarF/ABC1/UbiB kinase family protein [Bacteroidota bacterium]